MKAQMLTYRFPKRSQKVQKKVETARQRAVCILNKISEIAMKVWRIIQCKNMQTFYFAVDYIIFYEVTVVCCV